MPFRSAVCWRRFEMSRACWPRLPAPSARRAGNITNIKTLSRSRDFFDMAFDIEVVDVRHLSNIVAALKTCDRVVTAERARYE